MPDEKPYIKFDFFIEKDDDSDVYMGRVTEQFMKEFDMLLEKHKDKIIIQKL